MWNDFVLEMKMEIENICMWFKTENPVATKAIMWMYSHLQFGGLGGDSGTYDKMWATQSDFTHLDPLQIHCM